MRGKVGQILRIISSILECEVLHYLSGCSCKYVNINLVQNNIFVDVIVEYCSKIAKKFKFELLQKIILYWKRGW